MIVFFHGGGFVLGDIDAYDPLCRDLCAQTRCIVLSINYRLAPEYPFPTATNDCLAGLRWAVANEQALGGNLSAVTALRVRDALTKPLQGQILVYPVTDHYWSETPSYRENATGQGLARNHMIWFWDQYFPAADTRDWTATPLTTTCTEGVAPALVITAEREEGQAYAEKLSRAGVPFSIRCIGARSTGLSVAWRRQSTIKKQWRKSPTGLLKHNASQVVANHPVARNSQTMKQQVELFID